jgi:hypothetical protein
MRKISLLLTLSIILGFTGMAQKNQVSLTGTAPQIGATKKNPANRMQQVQYPHNPFSNGQPKLITTESFEGTFPPTGWTKQNPDGGTGWAQCADGVTPLDGWNGGTQTVPTGGGGFVAYCTYTTGGTSANDQWLISPQFLVSPMDSLSFSMWFFGAYIDTVQIRISTTTNAIGSFTTLLAMIDTNDLTPMSSWHQFKYSLAAFAGQNIYIAFREKVTDNFTDAAYIALDLFKFGSNVAFPNDIAPTAVTYPVSSQILTAADTVKVTVNNFDSAPHSNIPITYVVDGGTPVTETITASIPAMGSITYKFSQLHDFSIPGHVYNIMVYTAFPADGWVFNDTINVSVTNFRDVAPVSYDGPTVMAPATINPQATVINNGTLATTFDVTMLINGGYTSTKTVTNLAPGATQQVTFDPWNAVIGNYGITITTVLAADSVPANNTITDSVKVMILNKFYCYIAYDPSSALPNGPATSFLELPGDVTSLASHAGQNFVAGGTWGYGNRWFGGVYGDNTLITLDTITGARTVIGNMGIAITGLAFDYSTNTMYAVAWGTTSSLYKINILNGTATLVGVCDTTLLINLACDLSGNLFSLGMTTDYLYSINTTTGDATTIGPVGFDARYAQDMEFDQNSGILYMAAYNNTVGAGELRTVNTSTGATTLIGPFANDAEITGMAIPYNTALPAADAAAVSVNGLMSSCALGAAEPIQMTIQNYGSAPITSLDVKLIVDGGTPVTETVTTTIAPGNSYTYTFTATANLSAVGTHTITCITALTGDVLAWNDTATVVVDQVPVSTVPYAMGFEPTDNFDGWSIENTNGDSRTWAYAATGGNMAPGCAVYTYNVTSAADDWLISTCINFDAGETYQLTFYYKAYSATYPESMVVAIGTDNNSGALTTGLDNISNITSTTYLLRTINFTVSATGTYYIGWHCTSAADMWNLYVDDINIVKVTGVKENLTAQIGVYPNPAQDNLNIVSESIVSRIRITNVLGATVYESAENGNRFRINTAGFVSGVYFLNLETEEGSITRKLIIE